MIVHPILVAFRAMTRVKYHVGTSIIQTGFISSYFTRLGQHPILQKTNSKYIIDSTEKRGPITQCGNLTNLLPLRFLREINFRETRSSKSAIFAVSEALNF